MSTGAGASDLLHAEDTGLDEMVRGEQAVAARSPMQLFWRRFRRDKVAMTALGFIVLLIFVAIFAGPITKLVGTPPPNQQETAALDDFGLPSGPSSEHPFGVDPIGRDVFSRVLYGAQVSLTVAFVGTGLSVIFGVFLGTVAAFYRRWVDTMIARSLDVMLAFPVLLLGLGLATACSGENGCLGGLIQPGLSVVIFIIVLANTPYVARIIRGQVLSLREKEFVEASRLARRIQLADHVPRHPAQPRGADHRLRHALHPGEHPARGRAVVPRGRRAAAPCVVGRDALRRHIDLQRGVVVHVVPGPGAPPHRAGFQPRRRRAPGRTQSQGDQVPMTKDTKGRFMKRSVHWTLILGALLALTFGVAACGGDDGGGEQDTNTGTPAEGKKGGKLVALWAGDTDNIDPGITYSQWGLPIIRATQKTLYRPKIDDGSVVEPDLAEADPQISEDGCTVTVTIKTGVKFSPPVDREVTSKDVKYAIERGFFSNANNGYAQPYFGCAQGRQGRCQAGHEDSRHRDAGRHDDRVQPRSPPREPTSAPAASSPRRSSCR